MNTVVPGHDRWFFVPKPHPRHLEDFLGGEVEELCVTMEGSVQIGYAFSWRGCWWVLVRGPGQSSATMVSLGITSRDVAIGEAESLLADLGWCRA